MAEPDLCAFLLWEYEDKYFERPDIKAAVEEPMATQPPVEVILANVG